MTDTVAGRKEIHHELTDMLEIHLANLHALGLRLQCFHWNVEGPQFIALHELFENYYEQIHAEVDVTAERIRSLGEYAPGSLVEFSRMSRLSENKPLDADGMLQELITNFVVVREFASETLKLAGLSIDEVTSDMLINQLRILEKGIWMFRSSITRTEPYKEAKPRPEGTLRMFENNNDELPPHSII